MNSPELTCDDARGLAALAASGDVSPQERRALECHAAGCDGCRAAIVAFESLRGQLAEMCEESAPPHVYAAVRARVLSEIGERRRPGWLTSWPAFAATLACTLLLAVVIRRELSVTTQPPPAVAAGVQVARIGDAVPVIALPPLSRRIRRTATSVATREPAEPLVVQMFTDDPDVVIYWIADTKGKGSEREIMQ